MTLTFGTGDTETLKAEGDDWVGSCKPLTKVGPLADGEKLEG